MSRWRPAVLGAEAGTPTAGPDRRAPRRWSPRAPWSSARAPPSSPPAPWSRPRATTDLGGRGPRGARRPRRGARPRLAGAGAHAPVRAAAVDARPLGDREPPRCRSCSPAWSCSCRASALARAPRHPRATSRGPAARRPRARLRWVAAGAGPLVEEATWRELLWLLAPGRGRHPGARATGCSSSSLLAEATQPARERGRHAARGAGARSRSSAPARPARRPRARLAAGPRRAAAARRRAAARLAQEQERSRRLEDRARLARELHDSVGHGVTLMVLQAGAARATPGDDHREALAAVERSGRAVMADLHRVLGPARPPAPAAPDRARRGRPGRGSTRRCRPPAPPGLDVHRVVRELPADVAPATSRRSSSAACGRR